MRIVDKNAGKVTSDKAFVWCGAERCAAHDNLQASSPVSTRYFGQGVVDGGASYYYVRDRLGSVRQLVDASGKVRAEYDYDPYGNRTKLAGDLDSDVGYAGYFHHAADPTVNGLDFALYRAYDAKRGRWLNRDPIGERGGLNLYGYTNADPLNLVDVTGQDPWSKVATLVERVAGGLEKYGRTTYEGAVDALKNGEDVLFRDSATARQAAEDAGGGMCPIHDDAHTAGPGGEGARPHYHTGDRSGGHAFYSAAPPLLDFDDDGEVDWHDALEAVAPAVPFFTLTPEVQSTSNQPTPTQY